MEDAGEQLWRARLTGRIVPPSVVEGIDGLEQAYRLQLGQIDSSGFDLAGWKLGATNRTALGVVGLDQPFIGPVLKPFVFASGQAVPIFPPHAPKLETEFVLNLGQGLPPRPTDYTRDEVVGAIASVSPGFEIVASRVEGSLEGARLRMIAGGGLNAAVVVAPPVADWSAVDFIDVTVPVSINGEQLAEGSSAALMWTDFANALLYVINHPVLAGRGLRSGDIIPTGTCAGALPIKPGDRAAADFGPFGSVSARFVGASPSNWGRENAAD